jgi:hypothetical protein
MYEKSAYKDLNQAKKVFFLDEDHKNSYYYIREKIEISIIAERLASKTVKNLILFILILYMYGALCLKYVSGAESMVLGISYTIWGDATSF